MGLAAQRADHEIVGVLSRSQSDSWPSFNWDEALPEADLLLIAVSDDSISEVSERLAPHSQSIPVVAHMSGFVPLSALSPFHEDDIATGGFHPLQSLPDAERGAAALTGAYVGIGGDPLAVDTLTHLATSLGMFPFELDDSSRPAYHAAAAAAANFVVTSLAVSADLFESAGIDPRVSRPLVERAVANVFSEGAWASLTGPIARGDIETVVGHLAAAKEVSQHVGRQFALMAEATAIRAGREEDLHQWR